MTRGSRHTPSGEVACPHCGRMLRARSVEVGGTRVFCGYEPCGCAGEAAAARRDEELERGRAEEALRRSLVASVSANLKLTTFVNASRRMR